MLRPKKEETAAPLTSMRDLIRAFADAMNLIDPEVQDHHEKVSFLAYRLAEELGMSERERRMVFYGALLHDVGSIMEGGVSLLELEAVPRRLATAGAAILRRSQSTRFLSDIVRESQSPWRLLRELPAAAGRLLFIPQTIHLADVVALLIRPDEAILNQVARIRACVAEIGESEFHPEVLRAFDALCAREAVWLDAQYRPQVFLELIPDDRDISLDETLELTEFMSRIIDFRSPFTAMHSAGVAATAEALAQRAGMSAEECKMMRIAGYLHDVGKLKIPREILEKPGKLTPEEFNVMKEHAYYTHILLKDIRGFEQIAAWAALHHEKLNGAGYPFHLAADGLSPGSRIMAVADVFSAITEDRPYRKGMTREETVGVLRGDAARGALSGELVELLIADYDAINALREKRSRAASRRYQEMLAANKEEPS